MNQINPDGKAWDGRVGPLIVSALFVLFVVYLLI